MEVLKLESSGVGGCSDFVRAGIVAESRGRNTEQKGGGGPKLKFQETFLRVKVPHCGRVFFMNLETP